MSSRELHRKPPFALRLLPLLAALVLAGCAAQRLHDDGLKLIERGQGRDGLELLRQARDLQPTEARLRVDYLRELNSWLQAQAGQAENLRNQGRHDEAEKLYREMLDAAPGHVGAQRGLLGVAAHRAREGQYKLAEAALKKEDFAEAHRLAAELNRADPSDLRAVQLLARVNDADVAHRREAEVKKKADSPMAKPVSLQFRDAAIKMVFEALSRSTGINIVIDKDVKSDLRSTIFVTNVPLEEAIDLILVQNQLARRQLTPNSVLVYPATTAKQREYQDLHVRTFLLSNADAKHVQNVLKTLLKLRDVVVDERSNAVVLREPLETLAVAEKIIASQENVEPEVMLELEVMEVSRERLTNLGVAWPDNFQLSLPAGVGSNGTVTLDALREIKGGDLRLGSSVQSLGINLKLQDIDVNLLASPRLRARSREKATVLIGDKVPVIVNTVTPVQSGSPVVTGSVQYIDVGLKLEVLPQVYAEGEVGVRVNLEVSNIVREITGPQGSLAYQIGTRNAQTVLRLRDGETQVLAGLISDNDRNTGSRVPIVGQLPVLSKLFGSDNGSRAKSEIVLSITPRIVRHRPVDLAQSEIASGTESSVRGGGGGGGIDSPAPTPPTRARSGAPLVTAPPSPVQSPANSLLQPPSSITPSMSFTPGVPAPTPAPAPAPAAAPAPATSGEPAAPTTGTPTSRQRPGFAPPVPAPAPAPANSN
ncbi:type II secretory pathway, component HofQ [Burkholderiales bacterium JOSHI_001]|nr:type II secretory pathway, component HofQ [Burkholderiales bacterium JOSHI_001]